MPISQTSPALGQKLPTLSRGCKKQVLSQAIPRESELVGVKAIEDASLNSEVLLQWLTTTVFGCLWNSSPG